MSGHGLNVTAHGLYHLIVALGRAIGVIEKEIGCLVVPYKRVAQRPKPVVLCKLNVSVGRLEVPCIGGRVQHFSFHIVLGRYGVELLQNNLGRSAVTPAYNL